MPAEFPVEVRVSRDMGRLILVSIDRGMVTFEMPSGRLGECTESAWRELEVANAR